MLLEEEFDAKLDLAVVVAGVAVGVGDAFEGGGGAGDELRLRVAIGRGGVEGFQSGQIGEVGGVGVGCVVGDAVSDGLDVGYILVVEDVEGFSENLYGDAVGDGGALSDARIEADGSGIAEGVAAYLWDKVFSPEPLRLGPMPGMGTPVLVMTPGSLMAAQLFPPLRPPDWSHS